MTDAMAARDYCLCVLCKLFQIETKDNLSKYIPLFYPYFYKKFGVGILVPAVICGVNMFSSGLHATGFFFFCMIIRLLLIALSIHLSEASQEKADKVKEKARHQWS